MRTRTRPTRDHLEVTREAGFPRISLLSVLAGTLAAYGAFTLVAALIGAALSAADVDTDFTTNDWTGSGALAALATAATLLVAYLFGGYVAGRMARRSGMLHGLAVAISSLVLGGIVGGVVGALADDGVVERNLQSIGVPTTTDQVNNIAIVGLIVAVAAMLIGAIGGAMLGERWHTKLARRALDPEFGPAAEARSRVDREDHERQGRIDRDPLTRREAAVVQGRDAFFDGDRHDDDNRVNASTDRDGDDPDDGDRSSGRGERRDGTPDDESIDLRDRQADAGLDEDAIRRDEAVRQEARQEAARRQAEEAELHSSQRRPF